ncbi:hypothetical protein [Bernardetia sp.]|uniref:hypothetical protein n=1 Tax=Bernardetia sp. TaxID=1937974 RepID=UPI0025BA95B3|nr:hypothetical protein [Bernardetia sp.]
MNYSSKEISSAVGVILLLCIFIFTIYINFDTGEKIEEVKEVESIEEEKTKEIAVEPLKRPKTISTSSFSESELASLWKLENIHTDSIVVNHSEDKTYMKLHRELGFTNHNPFRDSVLVEIIGKDRMEELYKDFSPSRYTIYNGIISFQMAHASFQDFSIEHAEVEDFKPAMKEIATLMIDYQIESLTTSSELGNFTKIVLKDGREIFLIKKDAEIVEQSYQEIIENAIFLNDSTKIVYP